MVAVLRPGYFTFLNDFPKCWYAVGACYTIQCYFPWSPWSPLVLHSATQLVVSMSSTTHLSRITFLFVWFQIHPHRSRAARCHRFTPHQLHQPISNPGFTFQILLSYHDLSLVAVPSSRPSTNSHNSTNALAVCSPPGNKWFLPGPDPPTVAISLPMAHRSFPYWSWMALEATPFNHPWC